ncbi:MAG: 16S rRNA (adenine(1518)-N(6)/adenine(1519)-N(6))-dimethyltransferase RsmA [Gemmatimonadales bacterium]
MSIRLRGGRPPVLKRFGQHFLRDERILGEIADALAPVPGETVIEIGPGRGSLTDILAVRENRLVAVEIDRALSEQLRKRYSSNPRVTIVEADVLETDLGKLADGPFVVAGNVPYYITTPIIFHVLRAPYPRHMVFLVQLEVAERIVAKPSSRTYGALSVNVQAVATAQIIRHVPPGAFSPPPKVTSAVVRITPRSDPIIDVADAARFRGFVQGLFSMRRKQIGNVLRSVSVIGTDEIANVLDELGIDSRARPETLSPEMQVALMRAVKSPPPDQL